MLRVNFGSTPYSNDVVLFAGEATDSQNSDFEGSLDINLSNVPSTNANNTRANNINWERLRASVTLTETLPRASAMQLLREEIERQVLSYQYNSVSETLVWPLRDSSGSEAGQIEFSILKFDLKFLVSNNVSASELSLTPRIGNYFIPTGETSSSSGFLQSPSVAFYPSWGLSYPTNTGDYSYFNGVEDNLNPFILAGTAYQRDGIWFNLPPNSAVGYDFDNYSYAQNGTTPVVNGVREEALTVTPTDAVRTFKAGCDHAFGIVYFDRHGRPGFVNELGVVSVAPFGRTSEREDPDNLGTYLNGPCEISIALDGTPPSWAVAYQIVYSDMVTWEKFESYSVGGGFFEVNNDNHIDVSFNTLVKYQLDKGAIKDYSFTPGDKLRVISYKSSVNTNQEGALEFPSNPEAYTFDISDYITELNDIENPSSANQTDTNHVGKFLSLAKPFGNNPLSFTPGTSPNLWENKCVVEILTPRKQETEMVYYEIGEARKIYKTSELSDIANDRHNDGEPIITNQGSVYFKPVSIFVPQWNGTSWQISDINSFDYETRMLESSSVSDFISSKAWSKGRAHITYDRADTINYYNRIVYSEEMGDDISGLTFSSFNPGALSYKNLPKKYGSINYIGNYNQSVAVLQENKLSYVPVNRNVIEYADGDSNITLNQEVMGQHKESNGDFGCGSDQSAVLLRDGVLFFVDKSRQKVLASAGGQLKVISDIEMSSYFESEFDKLALAAGDGGRVVSGFDPMEGMYFVTIEPKAAGGGTAYSGATTGYSLSDGRWISRYDFIPSNYASIDNKMLSCNYYLDSKGYLFHSHSGNGAGQYNKFYNVAYPSSVQVVSKIIPSNVKVFNALSYEGDSDAWDISTDGLDTNLGCQTDGIIEWDEREGSYYASIPRDKSSNSTSQKIFLGDITNSGDDLTFTSNVRLNRQPIPLGSQTIVDSASTSHSVNISSISGNSITFNSAVSIANGGAYLILDSATNGDSMRGHWMKIKMQNSSNNKHELYCINTHFSDSKAHHPKGQQ